MYDFLGKTACFWLRNVVKKQIFMQILSRYNNKMYLCTLNGISCITDNIRNIQNFKRNGRLRC